ncbi:MAG: PLP-dependent aminotransferase family protein [Paracoccaceae bacterium]
MNKIDRVVRSIETSIDQGSFKPGDRLPSVRMAAAQFNVAKNTVVEAYARLQATQVVLAKPGSGFFVSSVGPAKKVEEEAIIEASDRMSLLQGQLTQQYSIRPGDGRPPQSWMTSALPKRVNLEKIIAEGNDQSGYGSPLGHGTLRDLIARRFATQGVAVNPNQVMTTFGANHALDLIIRRYVTAGQTVFIDDPGYYPLVAKLKLAKAKIVGVPRERNGPNLDKLEQLAKQHRPGLFFTQSTAQNPTGSSYNLQTAHNTLKLAYHHGFKIVDDDPFLDLQGIGVSGTRLWELDGFQSVIFIGTYSKLLSASFRSGFVVATSDIIQSLTDLKTVTSVNSSRLSEMLIGSMIKSGSYDQHLKQLALRLGEAKAECLETISDHGAKLRCADPEGFYTLIEFPRWVTPEKVSDIARKQSVFVAQGNHFFVSEEIPQATSMRINFTRCANRKFSRFLQKLGD